MPRRPCWAPLAIRFPQPRPRDFRITAGWSRAQRFRPSWRQPTNGWAIRLYEQGLPRFGQPMFRLPLGDCHFRWEFTRAPRGLFWDAGWRASEAFAGGWQTFSHRPGPTARDRCSGPQPRRAGLNRVEARLSQLLAPHRFCATTWSWPCWRADLWWGVQPAWNRQMKEPAGLEPGKITQGCLQESIGARECLAIFPPMLWDHVGSQPSWPRRWSGEQGPIGKACVAAGEEENMRPVAGRHVHPLLGAASSSEELVERVCGKPWAGGLFLSYSETKLERSRAWDSYFRRRKPCPWLHGEHRPCPRPDDAQSAARVAAFAVKQSCVLQRDR